MSSLKDFWHDHSETINIIAVVVAIVVGFIACVPTLVISMNYLEKPACDQLDSISDLDHHWDMWNGCLVRGPDGYWFTPEDYPYKKLDITP